MKDAIAKCGCNCSKCPTYKENLQTIHRRKHCSWGWKKYLNIRLSPEKLRLCDGCNLPDEKRKVYYLNCRVRKCAIRNGIENCAYCSAYPCQDVLNIHEIQVPNAREKIEDQLGTPIPQKDYLTFIKPYEGIKQLNEIHNSLESGDIIKMTHVSVIPVITPLPEDLRFTIEEKSAYRQIYQILSSLEVYKNVSYARQSVLKKNRKQLLKLLWTFGRFGELRKEGGMHFKLSSKDYANQKISSYHSKVQDYFHLLEKYGVQCEIVSIKGKRWLTTGGALRKEGWLMKMSFTKNLDNDSTFKALRNYTMLLNEKYSKNAFRYFSRADMRVLF